MPVIPDLSNLQDQQELYHFLLHIQQPVSKLDFPRIASISIKVDSLDPLAVLGEVLQPNQPYFYFERRLDQSSIAAFGKAVALNLNGKQRFSKSKHFIDFWQKRLTYNLPELSPCAAPRFLCSYTFFDAVDGSTSNISESTICLPEWQIIRQNDECFVTANVLLEEESNVVNLTDRIWHQLRQIRRTRYNLFPYPYELEAGLNPWTIQEVNHFQQGVCRALDAIRAHSLDKIVLAHAIDVVSQLPFQGLQSLHNLRRLYPDCWVFAVGNGSGQLFLGASPERLISIRDRHLDTDALAGSAPRGQSPVEDDALGRQLLNSKKERREHQLVADFMGDRLRRLGINPQLSNVPTLRRLPNIQHLHTPIQAIVPPGLHPLDILADLHPTPAVAGMPSHVACQYIRRYESFERSLYAAPIGWIDTQGNAEFIVGIRSALLEGYRARLYAGAGIVAGSSPEREMAEVKLKLQALLRALV